MAISLALTPAVAFADGADPQETVYRAAASGEAQLQQVVSAGTPVDITDDDGETTDPSGIKAPYCSKKGRRSTAEMRMVRRPS